MLVRIIARFQLAMAKPLMFLIVKNGEDERSRNETSVLVTVAAFDHWKRSQFVPWKAMLLVSAIFAFFCYKRQLARVGDALLETPSEHAGQPTIASEGTGKL